MSAIQSSQVRAVLLDVRCRLLSGISLASSSFQACHKRLGPIITSSSGSREKTCRSTHLRIVIVPTLYVCSFKSAALSCKCRSLKAPALGLVAFNFSPWPLEVVSTPFECCPFCAGSPALVSGTLRWRDLGLSFSHGLQQLELRGRSCRGCKLQFLGCWCWAHAEGETGCRIVTVCSSWNFAGAVAAAASSNSLDAGAGRTQKAKLTSRVVPERPGSS